MLNHSIKLCSINNNFLINFIKKNMIMSGPDNLRRIGYLTGKIVIIVMYIGFSKLALD